MSSSPRRDLSARSAKVLERLEREVIRIAAARYADEVRAWAASDEADATMPHPADTRAEVREELETLLRGLGRWAAPETDPFEVLGDDAIRRMERGWRGVLRRYEE